MLQALLFAALVLAQDPKPGKTVEDRLKELDDKIASLEKKHKTLLDENAALEKKLADSNAWREKMALQTAASWMKRHTDGLSLDKGHAEVLEAMWAGWTRQDLQKRPDQAAWKTREETLRQIITPEQAAHIAKAVRSELEAAARGSLAAIGKQAAIAPENSAVFSNTVLSRLSFDNAGLIPQAHPDAGITWARLQSAVEASLPSLGAVLTSEEHARLTKLLAQWNQQKPKEK